MVCIESVFAEFHSCSSSSGDFIRGTTALNGISLLRLPCVVLLLLRHATLLLLSLIVSLC